MLTISIKEIMIVEIKLTQHWTITDQIYTIKKLETKLKYGIEYRD